MSWKQPKTRRSPNGATRYRVMSVTSASEYIGCLKATQGTETSKYPEEEKTKVIPLVAASETGTA